MESNGPGLDSGRPGKVGTAEALEGVGDGPGSSRPADWRALAVLGQRWAPETASAETPLETASAETPFRPERGGNGGGNVLPVRTAAPLSRGSA